MKIFLLLQPPKGRMAACSLNQNLYIVNHLNISLSFPHVCVALISFKIFLCEKLSVLFIEFYSLT